MDNPPKVNMSHGEDLGPMVLPQPPPTVLAEAYRIVLADLELHRERLGLAIDTLKSIIECERRRG